MVGSDNPLNDGTQPYMAMEMLRQLSESFPAGSQVVGSSPNPANITLFAARTPDGGFGLHLVNENLVGDGVPDQVRINGLPEGIYELRLSEDSNLNQPPQAITTQHGSLSFALPDASVGYLVRSR